MAARGSAAGEAEQMACVGAHAMVGMAGEIGQLRQQLLQFVGMGFQQRAHAKAYVETGRRIGDDGEQRLQSMRILGDKDSSLSVAALL